MIGTVQEGSSAVLLGAMRSVDHAGASERKFWVGHVNL